MPLTKRIGVSTRFLPATHGEELWKALQLVLESGLRGIELVAADFQGQIGNTHTVRSVGLWPRRFKRAERDRLCGVLAQFDTVSIAAPHVGLNISSVNPGVREETARQYIECIQLAIDTGVRTVTFHGGAQTEGFVSDPAVIIEPTVKFGKLSCEFADEHDLTVGLRFGSLEQAKEVVGTVNHERFGVVLDIAQAAIGEQAPSRWVEAFGEKIVAVQVSGLLRTGGGYVEHEPLSRNNAIDYDGTLAALEAVDFGGPITCEILGVDIADTIGHCLVARDMLNELWGSLADATESETATPAPEPESAAGEETRDSE